MPERPELSEQVDLAPDHRRYVLEAHERLATLTHYELLGVPRDADKAAIKRAYFHLASIVHPDRYFGKRLGSYKPKLEALFARITEAYEALSTPVARASYDATLGAAPPAALAANIAPTAPAVPVNQAEEAKRRAAAEALEQQRAAASAMAKRHADIAARARAAGDFVAAAEAYRSARALAPQDAELAAAHAEMMREMASKMRDSFRRQALLEEKWGHWKEAAASWKKVVDTSPDDADAKEHLAQALAKTAGG